MKTLFAVPWIEVEYGWGQRYEGYKLFETVEDCISTTKRDSENGNYNGGYIGPERPLHYYKIPDSFGRPLPMFPKTLEFKSELIYIK